MLQYKNIMIMLLLFSAGLFAVSIDTDKKIYAQEEIVQVTVSGLPTPRNCTLDENAGAEGVKPKKNKKTKDCNWAGIFFAEDKSRAENIVAYQFISDGGSAVLQFDGLTDNAAYEARVFVKNNYKTKATSRFEVQSQNDKIQIRTAQNRFKTGESITVNISGMSGNEDDWIGLFYAFDESNLENTVYKIVLHGKKEGTFVFPGLDEAHLYEVRAFSKGNYIEEDYYPFEVIEGSNPANVTVSEILAANAHTLLDPDFSQFSDYIELHNSGSKRMDISGYKLSDKLTEVKWTIPDGTYIPAHGYIIIWADAKDTSIQAHHTNFKFKNKGEAIALFNPEGILVDSFSFGRQKADIAYGREGTDTGYMYPTPGEENWDVHMQLTEANVPEVSKNSGFYTNSVHVSLSADAGDEIYYTLDGSYPDLGSLHYSHPLTLTKTTVLRAMSVRDGIFPSERVSHTYFIDENSVLAVVSIMTDEKYLWDEKVGIYTEGINGAPLVCSEGFANYMQDWKRPAHIEFFDEMKNPGFTQEMEIKISGTCSRELAQKSLSVKADDIYGKDMIHYKLFNEKDIETFKAFKLRNSGQDWWKTMFRDAMIQQMIKDDLDIDYQAYRPAIVYINGEYWGIHNIREKKNEDYLAANYPGLDPDKVDILYGYAEVKEGNADAYEALIDYIESSGEDGLQDQQKYDYVVSQIDIANYIDYMITQIYIANQDWPYNNIRYWKEQKADAKWRWMMDDQDNGFNLFGNDGEADDTLNHNTLAWALAPDSTLEENAPWSTSLFRHLMKNAQFQNRFVNRYHTLLETTFQPDRVVALIQNMKSVIAPEMPRHIATWGDAGPDYATIYDWGSLTDVMIDFARKRPDIAREQLDEMFVY